MQHMEAFKDTLPIMCNGFKKANSFAHHDFVKICELFALEVEQGSNPYD